MAKRKSDLKVIGTGGIDAIDLRNPNRLEKEILSSALESRTNVKNLSINRLNGAKTEVTYFRQYISDKNDYLVNINPLNTVDLNTIRYIKVTDFLVKMSNLDYSFEDMEGGTKTTEGSGTIIVLPNTIQPIANDYFIMVYRGKQCLFRIIEVKPLSLDEDTAYECEFELHEGNFTYEGSDLEKQIADEYCFEQIYIGTDYRTIFRKEEYNKIQKLKEMYHEISDIYYQFFYDKILGTYLLKYDIKLLEKLETKKDFTVIDDDGIRFPEKHKPLVIDDRFNTAPIYRYFNAHKIDGIVKYPDECLMYDVELIEFMRRLRVFEYQDDMVVRPQLYKDKPSKFTDSYNNTLFYAVEKRNKKRFKMPYVLPVLNSTATTAFQPILYGKVSLVHTANLTNGCLSLYPFSIYSMVMNDSMFDLPAKDIPDSIELFNRIINIIVLYINERDTNIVDNLLYISEDLERFYEEIQDPVDIFYIYPILGHIIKDFVSILAQKKSNVVNTVSTPQSKE